MKESPNGLLTTCFLMLLLGIYLYIKSKEQDTDSAKLRNNKFINNKNSYLKNKAIILLIFSTLFILITLFSMIFGS